MANSVESVWSEWKTVKLLGKGSFGSVYEVVRERYGLTERSAVKIIEIPNDDAEVQSLKSDGMTNDNITKYYQGVVQDFVQEIALMSKLRGHTNIVGYDDYAVIERADRFGWDIYIRMELLTSLSSYMESKPNSTLDETDVIKMAIDICAALEVCFDRHIVHRDIKPDNIFVSEDGNFKLGDFGVARTVEKTMSGLSKKGTYTYMAPEIYKGELGGMNSDIYSLGIVLYKLLNDNREPFLPPFPQEIEYQHKQQALVRRMNGEVLPRTKRGSEALWHVVQKACAYNPKMRFQTPGEMKAALTAVLHGGNAKTAVPQPVGTPSFDETVAVKRVPSPVQKMPTSYPQPSNAMPPKAQTAEKNASISTGKIVAVTIVLLTAAIIICALLGVMIHQQDMNTYPSMSEEESLKVELDDLSREPVTLAPDVEVGDTVTFGRYEQNNDTTDGTEEIEWLVLDKKNGKALLLSKYALDCQPYHEWHTNQPWVDWTLREWLNDDFLSTAFNSIEENMLSVEMLDNSSSGDVDTYDKVFCLSDEEAISYFADYDARMCLPTEYAVAQGVHTDDEYESCWWWLRSLGEDDVAVGVGVFGTIKEHRSYVIPDEVGVRPAVWVDLDL